MFELQKRGILQQVDVVSSASGGSVSAALYAVSCDDGQTCAPPVTPNLNRTVWKESIIYPLLQRTTSTGGASTAGGPKTSSATPPTSTAPT